MEVYKVVVILFVMKIQGWFVWSQIPVVADLPVGENLQDHIFSGGLNFLLDAPVSVLQPRTFTLTQLSRFLAQGTGTPYRRSSLRFPGVSGSRRLAQVSLGWRITPAL